MASPLRYELMPDGRTWGYVLPDVTQLLLAGYFPTEEVRLAVREVVSGKTNEEIVRDAEGNPLQDKFGRLIKERVYRELSDTELRANEELKGRLVAKMLREIDGELVSFEWQQVLDADVLPVDNVNVLFVRGLTKRGPEADSEPSTNGAVPKARAKAAVKTTRGTR